MTTPAQLDALMEELTFEAALHDATDGANRGAVSARRRERALGKHRIPLRPG
jgi:hypothetical protein